jgi:signal transduction histidine kinase
MSLRLKAYVTATVVAAVAVLAIGWPQAFALDWGHYVAWIVICLVSETMWSYTLSGGGTCSLSATVGLASAALWGAGAGLWISALSTLIADVFVVRKPLVRAAFNASQIAVATAVGALLFQVLGGRVALPVGTGGGVLDRAHASSLMLPFVGLVVGYFVVNRAMVAVAVAWSSGRGFRQVLMEDWLYMARIEVDAASFLLTPLMVISFTTVGYPGVLLFYAPLFMLFQSDRRYLELKKAEEVNLRNARFAAKGELAAGIGHELNNQLVAISARAQMLLKDAEKQTFTNAPRHAQIIFDQSKRMGVLAKGLMDYTRSKVNVEPMDLNGMLTSTIDFVKSDKRFRGVEWEVQLDPELPQIRADAGQIQGVFINLFVNAADAMGAQETRKSISVRTRLDARTKSCEIDVQDTGPGIKKEHLGRMFEFMFTTKPDGHGFGLSTSHRTIENHGGKITVESEPGHGASFHIALPVSGPGSWH